MLKIHQLFLVKFIGLFFGTLVIASVIIFITLKGVVIKHNEQSLKESIALLEIGLQSYDNLDTLAKAVHAKTGFRVTIINDAGNVIAESDFNKQEMENHAGRVEILQASREPFGVTTRYSKTLKMHFLYVAKSELYRGQQIYLRISKSLSEIMHNFYSLISRLIFAFLFFIIAAFTVSYNMSKKIRDDILQIINYLDEIANKNYKAVIKTKHFSEFLQISLQLKNLVKKLNNRERQKRKYTAKLRLVNKQRNDILSAISHEFKNPIASIMGYAETLMDEPDVDTKVRQKFLEKVLSNGKKISLMLDRLALSVKLENNDIKLSKSTFDLCELCHDVTANLSKKYKERDIRSECEPMQVYADRTTIEMVIINLVDNAMKYSEDEVVVKLEENRLLVVDKGMGIAPSEIEKISSKFYRVEQNTWDNSLGLGLAIVSYILNLHHTTLIIESEIGHGSAFGFDIAMLLPSGTEA